MKLFFDMEFTGLHQRTTLISLGIVSDSGKTFYAELTDYDTDQLNPWLDENVISKLYLEPPIGGGVARVCFGTDGTTYLGSHEHLCKHLAEWLEQFDQIEMISDCMAYDWVLFCEIWGGAFGVPKNINYIPTDICTIFRMKGIDPDISREEFIKPRMLNSKDVLPTQEHPDKHNALWDAKVIMACYEKLMDTPT